jgi:hypothetical protein
MRGRSWGLLCRLNPVGLRLSSSFASIRPIYFQFHRTLSKRFPFGIYYEIEGDVIYVYAILDLRRDPVGFASTCIAETSGVELQ